MRLTAECNTRAKCGALEPGVRISVKNIVSSG
jgi:hypothetical protein